ncbi:MAG: 2Fe-2S iron-sulfur cluster-binding protein [Hyphomicrobiaceae bacterium]
MKVTVQSKSGIASFDCDEDENLLFAGLRCGVALPYECATGTCGTCRARIMEGDVDLRWDRAPGLAFVKREKNEVLLCQAAARGNCTIRVPANIGAIATPPGAPRVFSGTVSKPRPLTHDVVEFDVTLDAPMSFLAGQFAVLEIGDVAGGRAYSMVNHQASTDRLVFVVKRKPGGGFSDWLFDRASGDTPVRVFGPLGRATFRPDEDKNFVCIAGGSGIAGMMAIAEHATSNGYMDGHRGHIFFGVRTLEDCFYMREFADYVRRSNGALEVTVALSNETATASHHPEHPEVALASGFVHEVAARAMAGRYDNMVGFVAGPPPMVDGALRMLIMEARLPAQFIRYDKFG